LGGQGKGGVSRKRKTCSIRGAKGRWRKSSGGAGVTEGVYKGGARKGRRRKGEKGINAIRFQRKKPIGKIVRGRRPAEQELFPLQPLHQSWPKTCTRNKEAGLTEGGLFVYTNTEGKGHKKMGSKRASPGKV